MKELASLLGLIIAASTSFSVFAAEENYPNRPIRFIVPFAAGGPTDVVARKLAERVTLRLGQPIIIDNRAGAATLIGTEAVMNAPPDGYSVLFTNTSLVQLPALMSKASYVPDRDFIPVAQICGVPQVLTVNSELQVGDLASLVAYLRANPGKTNYASPGYGGTANIYGEELLRTFKLKAEHIAYKGEFAIIPDFITNRVQWYFATPSQILPHVQQGKLRPLAVTGPKRLAKLPDVPTLGELGASTFDTVGWFGVFLPARTPRPVAERLSQEILAVLREPQFAQFVDDNMFVPLSVGLAEFEPEIARISAIWSRMIRDNEIKVQ